jgi:hypothetical protein
MIYGPINGNKMSIHEQFITSYLHIEICGNMAGAPRQRALHVLHSSDSARVDKLLDFLGLS